MRTQKNFSNIFKIKRLTKSKSECTFCKYYGHEALNCPIKKRRPYKIKKKKMDYQRRTCRKNKHNLGCKRKGICWWIKFLGCKRQFQLEIKKNIELPTTNLMDASKCWGSIDSLVLHFCSWYVSRQEHLAVRSLTMSALGIWWETNLSSIC